MYFFFIKLSVENDQNKLFRFTTTENILRVEKNKVWVNLFFVEKNSPKI